MEGRRDSSSQLHNRITLLEIALAQSQAVISPVPHPLLESTYFYSSRDGTSKRLASEAKEEEGIVDGNHGTLTLLPSGQARFVGSFAGSEYLREELQEHKGRSEMTGITASGTTDDCASGEELGKLRLLLPIWETEGAGLVETYWENVNWMYV